MFERCSHIDRTSLFRENSTLKRSEWCVLTRDHAVLPATHTFINARVEWAILPFLSSSASPHFGRYSFPVPQRLSWPGWLVAYRDGMFHPKTLTQPSTNRPITRRPGIEHTTSRNSDDLTTNTEPAIDSAEAHTGRRALLAVGLVTRWHRIRPGTAWQSKDL